MTARREPQPTPARPAHARAGADKKRTPSAKADPFVADVIGRTGPKVRCRLRGNGATRIGTLAIGERVIVAGEYEHVAADVIGLPSPGVVELALVIEIEKTSTIEIRKSWIRIRSKR